MRIVLIGPPGCGKGTQAVLIQEEYGVPHLSSGNILREAMREKSPLGLEAEKYINKGNLCPDDLILKLMSEKLKGSDCSNGYILDGFPRTVVQAEGLDDLLKIGNRQLDMVISFEVGDDEVIKRLSGRRQCSKCGENFHIEFKKPAKEGFCNKCEAPLYQREDDKEKTIMARLKVYRNQTAPLIDYYKKTGLLKSVYGMGTIDDIYNRVGSLIKNNTPQR